MSARVGGKLIINNEEYDRLINEGWTQKQIASALNISQSTITRYKKEREHE